MAQHNNPFPFYFLLFKLSDRVIAELFKIINRFSFMRNFSYLPFGFGRERPIRFEDKVFYFQHGSKEEVENYLNVQKKSPRK